jgi:hypothetical protein
VVSTITQGAAGVTQGAVSTVTQGAAAATQGAVATVTQTSGDAGSALTQATGSSAAQTAVPSVTQVAESAAQGEASSIAQTAGSSGQAVSGGAKKTLQASDGSGRTVPALTPRRRNGAQPACCITAPELGQGWRRR